MARRDFPLKNHKSALSSSIEFQENYTLETKDSSKMYLRHLRKRKTQPGFCSVFSTQRYNIMCKKNLHLRVSENFEKLYDTSPKSKKIKLTNARKCGYKNLILNKSSVNRSQMSLDKSTNSSTALGRFPSRNNIIKSLFPTTKAQLINVN